MVDLQLTNQKLHERAKRTVQMLTDLSEEEAEKLLHQAGGHVKTALLMEWTGSDEKTCKSMLERNGGSIRKVLDQMH
jgi:N-acetylmuramic acid 6-phosphate etherase